MMVGLIKAEFPSQEALADYLHDACKLTIFCAMGDTACEGLGKHSWLKTYTTIVK